MPPQTDDVITLNAFTVRSENDRGYLATQSISGSRFVTDLKDFPFNLQVLPSGFIKDINAAQLPDVLIYATGVLAGQQNQFTDVSVVQRGFRTQLQLRDGVRKSGAFDAAGAERIEVINGPSSVLFGITNPGGTINTVSKKPVHRPLAELTQTVGQYGYSRTVIDIGGPLGNTDAVTFRMPISYTHSDGYFVNSGSKKAYAAPVFAWRFRPGTTLELSLEVQRFESTPVTNLLADLDNPAALAFFLPRDFNGNTAKMYSDVSTALPSLTIMHRFGRNWQLRSSSSYYVNLNESFYSKRGAVRETQNYAYPRQAEFRNVSDRSFQHNTDLVGTFDTLGGNLTSIVGVEYRDSFNRTYERSSLVAGATAPPAWLLLNPSTWNYDEDNFSGMRPQANSTTDFQSTAYSALAQYKALSDRLTIAGGARRDETKSLFTNIHAGKATEVFNASKTTLQLGGLYWLKPDRWSVYANYSTSFEPLNRPLTDINFQSFHADPVTGKGIEFGARNMLAGGRFVHGLSFYRIEQANLPSSLLRSSTATTVSFYDTQGGVHRSEGVEYSFNAALSQNLAFFGGAIYNDAHVVADNNPVPARNTLGQRLALAFRYKANVFTKYTIPSGPLKNVSIGAGYIHVDDAPQQVGSLNSVLLMPSYGVVNLLVGYRWNMGDYPWEAQANINNVLSRDYVHIGSINRSHPANAQITFRIKL